MCQEFPEKQEQERHLSTRLLYSWKEDNDVKLLTWEMEPPWIKEGLSAGLVVGISGGGEGMFGGRLGLLNVTRTPSGILWTSWLGAGWRTGENIKKNNKNYSLGLNHFTVRNKKGAQQQVNNKVKHLLPQATFTFIFYQYCKNRCL